MSNQDIMELSMWKEFIRVKLYHCPSKERRYIKLFMRRINYLDRKIAREPEANSVSFSKQEIAALAWAVNKLTGFTE